MAHAVDYAQWRARSPGTIPDLSDVDANRARRQILAAVRESEEWITGMAAMEVLTAYGIDCARTVSVVDVDQAVAASSMGLPVVMKAFGPDLVHKTEVGGVRIDLRTEAEIRDAFQTMQRSIGPAMTGALVQPMIHGAVETIVGFAVDPAFGPQVLFGLGGTAVELLNDHVSRPTPLTDSDAREMVLGLRATPLLTGFRGRAPVDIEALIHLILRMARLAEDLPELVEADCNPVMATAGKGRRHRRSDYASRQDHRRRKTAAVTSNDGYGERRLTLTLSRTRATDLSMVVSTGQSRHRLRGNDNDGAHGPMDELLAGATDHRTQGTTGPPSPHHDEVGRLLPGCRHGGLDRLTVNHDGPVTNSAGGERTTPFVL